MIILKFGGTSLGTPDRIKNLISFIRGEENRMVVLSATASTTDSLEEICQLLYIDRKQNGMISWLSGLQEPMVRPWPPGITSGIFRKLIIPMIFFRVRVIFFLR